MVPPVWSHLAGSTGLVANTFPAHHGSGRLSWAQDTEGSTAVQDRPQEECPPPAPRAGEFVRDVCWLGEDSREFRDDYPLSFPPEPPERPETGA